MNWFDLLPHGLAKAQIAWEQDAWAMRVRRSGLSVKRLAAYLHISQDRVRGMIARAELRELRGRKSPVERSCATLDDAVVVDYFLNDSEIGISGPELPSDFAQATLTRLRKPPCDSRSSPKTTSRPSSLQPSC